MAEPTPLFDANAHPTLRGVALGKAASFGLLRQTMGECGVIGACAVALPGTAGYDPRAYFEAATVQPGLVPVAAWTDVPAVEIEGRMQALRAIGYRAIKIHPRLCGLSVREPRYREVLRQAREAGMVVFQCTYPYGTVGTAHPVDPLPPLLEAVAEVAGIRMVWLHGGALEVLRYAEAVRGARNILLDLSFTLIRYQGSSVDLDLAYLFRTFDQRICLGSDFPEYGLAEVRERFEALARGLPEDKRENIGWRNISSFLGVPGKC